MTKRVCAIGAATLLLALFLLPGRCLALYGYEGEEHGFALSAAMNTGVGLAAYPGDGVLFGERLAKPWNCDLRLVADAHAGDHWRAKLNILENVRTAQVLQLMGGLAPADIERSSLLFWQQHEGDNSRADLLLDAGSIAWGDENRELILGRQPVQFSVTATFAPNDFFAPFTPQQFYRVYKPGVDAFRYEHRLAGLAQFSLVAALGYSEDPESDNGWSRGPDWRRTSVLGRYVRSGGGFEWGVLTGRICEEWVGGASLQGELTEWLGLRAEGNCRGGEGKAGDRGCMASAGLEHRFANSLTARLEQMYNSRGFSSFTKAELTLASGDMAPGYLGRHYTALDLGYEFSPLMNGEFLYLRNWTDGSQSISLYAVWSLADEAELALQATIPAGREPAGLALGSELGMQPARFTLEYRHYF